MFCFRSMGLVTIGAFVGVIVAACGGQQVTQSGVLSPKQGSFARAIPNADDCGGTGRVRVKPCPVTLTNKKSQVVVVVSGPKVDDSAVVDTACMKKKICGVGQYTSVPVKWWVSGGPKCGSGVIRFYGYDDATGGTVGIANLKVISKVC